MSMSTRSKAKQKTKTPTWEELNEIFPNFVSRDEVDELRKENQNLSQTLQKVIQDMDEVKRAAGIPKDPSSKSQASEVQDSSRTRAESSDSTAQSQPPWAQTTSIPQMYPAVQKPAAEPEQETTALQESGSESKQREASLDQLRQDIESIHQKQNDFDHKLENTLQNLKEFREFIKKQETVNQELRSEVDEVKKLMNKLEEVSSDQDSTPRASHPDKKAASKINLMNVCKVVKDLKSKVESSCDGWSQQSEALNKKVLHLEEEIKNALEGKKNEQENRLTEGKESYHSTRQSQIASWQEKLDGLVRQLSEEQRKVKDLETRVGGTETDNNNRDVSFHARLGSPVTKKEPVPLVCKEVVTNRGDAYDPNSGLFTCPLPGAYCFLVTSSPNRRSQDAVAALDIVVDGEVRGGVCAYQYHWSSGHCVVVLEKGQKVWLRTIQGKHHYAGEWWTTFTGFLLKADPLAYLEKRGEQQIHEGDHPGETEGNTE